MNAAGRLGWMDAAACLQVGPDLFFEEGQGGGTDPVEAKALCRSCESRTDCLAWALEHEIREGLFGGYTDRPRRRIARLHAAGAPLEDIIAADDAQFYARLEKSQEIAVAAAARKRELDRARVALKRAQPGGPPRAAKAAAAASVTPTVPQSRQEAA